MKRIQRDFQKRAIDTILPLIGKERRISLVMPQGSGITLTALTILYEYQKLNETKQKFLIFTERKALVEQLEDTLNRSFEDDREFIESIQVKVPMSLKLDDDKYLDATVIMAFQCERLFNNKRLSYLLSDFQSKTIIGVFTNWNIPTYFGDVTFKLDINEIAKVLGWKSPIISRRRPNIETDNIKDDSKTDILTKIKDTSQASMSKLAQDIYTNVKDEKTIIFCPSIKVAKTITQEINELANKNICQTLVSEAFNFNSKYDIIAQFKDSEELSILTTVGILATDIHFNNVQNIVFISHLSPSKYEQIINNYILQTPPDVQLKVFDYGNNQIESEAFPSVVEQDKPIAKPSCTKTNIYLRDRQQLNGVMGVKDLAAELSEIIYKMPFEQGRMIGIFGRWGRGKTFLVNEIWECLKSNKGIVRIDFQAWKYQETPAIWAYLYETFAKSYYNSVPMPQRLWRIFKLNITRIGAKEICSFLVLLLGSFIGMLWAPIALGLFGKITSSLAISCLLAFGHVFLQHKDSALKLFEKYYKKPTFSHILGIQAEVQKELKTLIKTWNKCTKDLKIFLFVDDIDRCSENKIIQLIDSLRVMLDDEELAKKIIVVTAVDEHILKRAIHFKYFDNYNTEIKSENLITEYLDKLFIISIKLGNLNQEEREEFFSELTKEDCENFNIDTLQSAQHIERNAINDPTEEVENEHIEEIAENFSENTANSDMDIESNSEYQSSDAESIPKAKPNSTLTQYEYQVLKNKLLLFETATPRQLRIFYYRYLIAKNLLINQYSKIHRENIWISSEYLPHLIELLILISKTQNVSVITQQKEEIQRNNTETYPILLLKDIYVNRTDYAILLNVLDMVMAY